MIIKVKEKRNELPRQLDTIHFDEDGRIDFVTTRDPDTGHDPADHDFDDLIWDVTIEEEDIDKFKLCVKDEEEK